MEGIAFTTERVKDSCKGLFYRLRINDHIDSRGNIVFQTRLSLLKRKSCPGCEKCGGLIECVQEDFANDCAPIIKGRHPVDEGLYQLVFIPGGVDYESGCLDSWELHFIHVKE